MFKQMIAVVVALAVAAPAAAGITVYEDEENGKKIEIGGRLQLQYHQTDPNDGESTDELFFRRLRPYITGTVTENWEGKIQFDIGKGEDTNEVAVKDAYMRYKGGGFDLTIGNQKPFFSREFLTSSKRQQLVERTFSGDHNYGSPDRALGVGLSGKSTEKFVTWGAFAGQASLDPDAKKLDFDSPVNRNSDFNEGWLASGRIDFHPQGELKMEQGDFAEDLKTTIGVAAYTWSNDDDNNTRTELGIATDPGKPDVDSASGFELSGGLRVSGFSADAEFQSLTTDSVDDIFSGGIYVNGSSDIDKLSLEGGYMVVPKAFEVVGGYETFDADGYQDAWNRTSFGANYFWNKYKVKVQGTYRIGENLDGVTGNDADEIFVQFQFVF